MNGKRIPDTIWTRTGEVFLVIVMIVGTLAICFLDYQLILTFCGKQTYLLSTDFSSIFEKIGDQAQSQPPGPIPMLPIACFELLGELVAWLMALFMFFMTPIMFIWYFWIAYEFCKSRKKII
jgi:hypothetical protein